MGKQVWGKNGMMRGRGLWNCLYFAVTMTVFLRALCFFCWFLGQHPGNNFKENLRKAQIILHKTANRVTTPTWNLTLTDDRKTTFAKTETQIHTDSIRV